MNNAPKKWTIIFLVSAKSNLYNEMIAAINEIWGVGSNEHINYIIIYDGLKAGSLNAQLSEPSIYYADSNVSFSVSQPWKTYPQSDLTDEKHLSAIIKGIKTDFPAEHYGFVYKGHGGRGDVDINNGITIEDIIPIPADINIDDDGAVDRYLKLIGKKEPAGFFDLQSMSTAENHSIVLIYKSKNTRTLSHVNITNVLRKNFAGAKELGFVFMDCCWAMQIENLYEYKRLTKYYVASADEMPALGLGKGYSNFCHKLNDRPQVKYDEIADLLISIYYANMYDDYDQVDGPVNFRKMGVSLTCADATDLKYFIEEFDNFCRILNENMDVMHIIFAEAREKCHDFTYEPEKEFEVYNIDLMWFLENLFFFNRKFNLNNKELEASISELMRIFMLYLRKSFMGSNYQDPYPGSRKRICRGITITFPIKKEGLASDNNQIGPKRRKKIRFYKETGWPAVLENYFETVEKYKASVTGMKMPVKIQVAASFKFHGFKKKSVDTITVERYRERMEDLQSIYLDFRKGRRFINYSS